jgi:hypothetical protein
MKIHHALCAAAIIALPNVALAADPVPANALGMIEATVNYCAAADAKSADQYKEFGKAVVREMTEKQLADARKSAEYKESYENITTELKKIPAEKAVESCHAALQSDKGDNK